MPHLSKRTSATASQSADESDFDVVLAAVIERLQADGQAKLDDCVREFPQYEERLRRLVPCMQVLAEFGHSSAAGADELPLSSEDTPSLGRELGDFRLLDEIGRGGMGIVYEAEQLSLSRRVALKVLPFAGMLDSRQIARFKNEARAAASLDHPHIVSVISVGSQRSVHYYAMQYIEGQTLAQVIAKQRGGDAEPQSDEKPAVSDTLPVAILSTHRDANPSERFRTIADLGIQAAGALAYSHEMGIVHRDIKPSNLLLDDDGKLSITDFGLAQIEGTGNLTMTGDLVGTLRYMSPEQAAGEKLLDGRTDVYSLGITLYELLTLRPAFVGTDKAKLLRDILEHEPPTPRSINTDIPRDLETIILKAIEKEPQYRYKSAAALASDLERLLDHQPIRARRHSFFHKFSKWSYRHRGILLTAAATLLVSLSFATFYIAKAYRNESTERRHAQANLEFAREVVDDMYVDLAQEWITTETAVSSVQTHFLQKAASFYDRLAKEPITDEASRHAKAVAYRRAGEIRFYLRQTYSAIEPLSQAVSLYQDLLEQQPNSPNLHVELAEAYLRLGMVREEILLLDDAEEAYDLGRGQIAKVGSTSEGSQKQVQLLARLELSRAKLLLHTSRPQQIEPEIRRLYKRWQQRAEKNENELGPNLRRYESAALLVQLLRHTDRLDEAEEIGTHELALCQRLRSLTFHDSRSLADLEVDLSRQLAEVSLADGHLDKARQRFEETLKLKAGTFKAGLDPSTFVMTSFFNKQINLDENFEHHGFCDYAQLQLRQAKVLQQLGRHYDAELALGDALSTLQVISDIRPEELRFRITWASGCSQVAQLLQDDRPSDAKIALEMATALWRNNQRSFPRAERYISGLHGLSSDLEQFKSKHPESDITATGPSERATREKLKKTIFDQHVLTVAWFRLGKNWKSSVEAFTQLAQKRTHGQCFDWFYVAMAHCHLNQHEQARPWFEKASKQMQEMQNPDPALQRLYEEARNLLEQRDAVPASSANTPHQGGPADIGWTAQPQDVSRLTTSQVATSHLPSVFNRRVSQRQTPHEKASCRCATQPTFWPGHPHYS